MDIKDVLALAKQHIDQPKPYRVITTEDLKDCIGYTLVTPLGNGIIQSVVDFPFTRRINNKTYTLYTITLKGTTIKRITTYGYTQWRIE